MTTLELQNKIIRKILDTKDPNLLDFVNSILSGDQSTTDYQVSDTERALIKDSLADYQAGKTHSHDDVTGRLDKWLEK